MDVSYVKNLSGELWDDFQCKLLQAGGNKNFWDFIKQYNMEWKPIVPKYKSKEAKYYRRMLAAKAENREFKEDPPLKNIEDALNKGVKVAKEAGGKAEVSLKKVGNYL